MMKNNTFNINAYLAIVISALLLYSPLATAHSGHSHSQFDSLTGILHALTTHPLLFGAAGLVFIVAALNARQ